MLDYTALSTLAAILRTGSFEQAATQLGITPSAVSQRIKTLEDRVGAPLLHRGAPARPTDLGARLLAHTESVAAMENALLGPRAPRAQRPTLRIACNADSLGTWVLPALAEVPEFLFDLEIDDQDRTAELLRRGEVQAAITSEATQVAGCIAYPLGALRYRAVASPAYIAAHFPDGVSEASLRRAPCLTFNAKDKLQVQWVQQTLGMRISPPSHYIPSTTAFVEAARLGLGWGMNPDCLVAGHLADGHLVELVPNHPFDTPLFWQVNRVVAASLAPLTKAIRRHAARALIKQV